MHGQVTRSLVLDLKSTPMMDWLKTSILSWRAAAMEKGLQWNATIPENLSLIDIDQERIAQVTDNLLSNGVKFTPKGGRLEVNAGIEGFEMWFQVSDNGQGNDPNGSERIYEPFYRRERTLHFPQGLGLGLTIALDIVQGHGGYLDLSSNPGSGSHFTVYLPFESPN